MRFPSATWRFRDNTREHDGYLFVDADSGRIVPVTYSLIGSKGYRFIGIGLWFHDLSDFEIVTTHIKRSGTVKWLHEYYRITENWMQWSNQRADIFHELVEDADVPAGYRKEFQRIMDKSELMRRPEYEPESLALP